MSKRKKELHQYSHLLPSDAQIQYIHYTHVLDLFKCIKLNIYVNCTS